MARIFRSALVTMVLCAAHLPRAQSVAVVEFDVVSIRPNTAGPGAGGGIRTLPDGTVMMTNQPIRSVIMAAAPVPVREVVGIPDWVNTERYDITAKPPAGATREQVTQMWQALFSERMKLVAHVEEREQDTFGLVLARRDGRLGPRLTQSPLECSPRPPGSEPQPPPLSPPSAADVANRCGMAMNRTSIVSGGVTMDQLARSISGLAGRLVRNRTDLQGFYALTLTFAPPRRLSARQDVAPPDDAPEIFTALQEQLGLRLQPEKAMVPVFVVEHIERPSPN